MKAQVNIDLVASSRLSKTKEIGTTTNLAQNGIQIEFFRGENEEREQPFPLRQREVYDRFVAAVAQGLDNAERAASLVCRTRTQDSEITDILRHFRFILSLRKQPYSRS